MDEESIPTASRTTLTMVRIGATLASQNVGSKRRTVSSAGTEICFRVTKQDR